MKMIWRLLLLSALLTLFPACAYEELARGGRPSESTLTDDPSGTWYVEYTVGGASTGKLALVVGSRTRPIGGKIYFIVESDEADPSLRAIRFHRDQGDLRIDWAFDGGPGRELGIEQSVLTDGNFGEFILSTPRGERFARLTKK